MDWNVQAQERAKPDASAIYVPGNQTAKAVEEAIEAEIPLVVAVAEHVPIHDILRVCMLPLSILSRNLLTVIVDPQHAPNPIKNPPRGRKLPRHHLRNRQMPNRLPATTMLCARQHRHRGQIRHTELRDCGIDYPSWTGTESLH